MMRVKTVGKQLLPLLISIAAMVFTFKGVEITFQPGVDPPLFWVFNYLAETDLSRGQHILFPHDGFLRKRIRQV